MSDLQIETAESDLAATPLNNGNAANNDGANAAIATGKDAPEAGSETKAVENGANKTEESAEVDSENAGTSSNVKVSKYDKSKAQRFTKPRNESKFDPSTLPVTDDPSKIRAQVYLLEASFLLSIH